jgi:HEAT repeat protein
MATAGWRDKLEVMMFERMRADRAAKRAARAGDSATLIELLRDPDPKVRENTANACVLIGSGPAPPSVVDALLHAAVDPEAEVRGQAIFALGSLRAPEGADVFLRALADDDWGVRMFAATAMGWMPDPRATTLLVGLLEDDQPFVRQFAVSALGEIGDPGVKPAIEALLENERDTVVKKWSKEALKKLGRRPPS